MNGITHTDEVKLARREARNGFSYPEISLSTKGEPLTAVSADSKHVLVIGAGVSGLMVAWMLLDKGYRVTILADDWAWTNDFERSRMTSQIAGALWEFPPGGCGLTEINETSGSGGWAAIEHYREWALQSYEFYQKYCCDVSNYHEDTGHSFGLRFAKLHQFFYTDVNKPENENEYAKLQAIQEAKERMGEVEIHTREELRTKFKDIIQPDFQNQSLESAYSHRAPIINTDKAMAYLMALVMAKGASMESRKLDKPIRDIGKQLLRDFDAQAIVNATGLGAKELANDPDVYPVRGAVRRVENTHRGQFRHLNDAYLVPAQRDENNHPTKTVFIVPRNDDVLYVGSIIQPNNDELKLTPDSPEVQVMWDRASEFMPSLRHAGFCPGYPFAQGLRPFTTKNAKVRADENADFPLVHNYGHGGSGWTLGVGTARCAVAILEQLWDLGSSALKDKAVAVNRDVCKPSDATEDSLAADPCQNKDKLFFKGLVRKNVV
ncbi:hypothetical protein CDD83_6486 [Cordyceps sp. RAO-2017]|nr:hypothetical protein CDD83_6486 [Cordyceps sp. RAO-2017]